LTHYVKVKVDIVVGREDRGGQFSGSEEMTKISARVTTAYGTTTFRIDGALILRVARVLDKHAAFAGVKAGVARGARGEDAIHHVDAARDVVGDLFGTADAH